MNLQNLAEYTFNKKIISIDLSIKEKIESSFSFLTEFSSDKIIYGINTGFGPMAQFKIDDTKLNELQYNLIRSHSSGMGLPLEEEYARAVIVARLNNFLQANSGVSYGVVEKLVEFLNNNIVPEIYEHGGVGASGDLVQLAHLALNLIGEGFVSYNGERKPTMEVLNLLNIKPLDIKLRDGLGLMNGTSCMTGIGAVNLYYSEILLNWGVVASSIINEIVEAYDDSFSFELNNVKKHKGQLHIAEEMRKFLADSELIKKRDELYNDSEALDTFKFDKKIQEYYSIRCVPQILGPVKDTIDFSKEVIENELNSTNDNPIVSIEHQNVLHGGNFHGDYISLEMDKLKIVVTKLTMLAERQLNFLLNSKLNEQFPSFLNAKTLGFNFGIQGLQFPATSTTAESQMLSNPMYVHSIPNNNDNQDIVSMGTNSALIAKKVIDNGFQVMAIHMIAVCQAIDLLSESQKNKLSSKTQATYKLIRSKFQFIENDLPQFENIKQVISLLKNNSIAL
jgi:histidine ammonia-lyase